MGRIEGVNFQTMAQFRARSFVDTDSSRGTLEIFVRSSSLMKEVLDINSTRTQHFNTLEQTGNMSVVGATAMNGNLTVTGSSVLSGSLVNIGAITQTGVSTFNGIVTLTKSANDSGDVLYLRNSSNGISAYTELGFGNDAQSGEAQGGVISYGGSQVTTVSSRNALHIWNRANANLIFGTNNSAKADFSGTGLLSLYQGLTVSGSLILSGSSHSITGLVTIQDRGTTIAGTTIGNA
jgi:hypothetical protein